jgi:hypothetical protein
VRAVRIEPATEGTGLAEVDLDNLILLCLAIAGSRVVVVVGDITIDLFGSN